MCWQPRAKRLISGLFLRWLLLLCVLVVTGTASGQPASSFGRYYALVIGNQNYDHLKDLKTPLADATEVGRVLKEQYGFEVELLLDATRDQLMRAISRLRKSLNREQDNLLIYYAGHGYLDPYSGVGYWQPVNAEKDNDVDWIPTSRITSLLKVIRAKHVLVIADSCYSGSLLTRESGAELASGMGRDEWFQRMLERRSRTALTSGEEEPVWDAGGGKHSVFAKAFLDVLRNNHEILDGDGLFDRIKRPVALNATQTPQYGDIRMTDHQQGDFLLVPRHLQKAGLGGKKIKGLKPDDFRGDLSETTSIKPIEEEYKAKKNARIRQQPNVSSAQVGTLKKGASIWVAGQVLDQPWYLVENDGKQGYVFSSLLAPSALEATNENTMVEESSDPLTDPITGMQFVFIKPDCFQMGNDSRDSYDNQNPVHKVCLTQGYYLGKYEVTQAQWKKIIGNNPSSFKGNNKPIEGVSWDDVQSYIRKLNQQTGRQYRLPTEAEWEYACRAAATNQYFCGGNDADSVAWYAENSNNKTHDVGQKQPNALQLYDMSGNVWEWVQDWYDSGYYSISPSDDPKGPLYGFQRVIRGGSWSGKKSTRYMYMSIPTAKRGYVTPDYSDDKLGFRLARTP